MQISKILFLTGIDLILIWSDSNYGIVKVSMLILLQENLKRINYCRTRVNGKKFHPKRPSCQSCWNGERRKSDDDAMDQGVGQVSVAVHCNATAVGEKKGKKEEIHRSLAWSLDVICLVVKLFGFGWAEWMTSSQSFGVGNNPHNSAVVNSHYIVISFVWSFSIK